MFNNIYLISIRGKDLRRFLRYLYKRNIKFINITNLEDVLYCKIDQINYKNLLDIKTSYEIRLEKVYGLFYIKKLIKDNIIFIISFIFGIIYLLVLSNIIFKVDIIHDDKEIRDILKRDLELLNIKKYSFVKSYGEINEIKEKIKEKNKDIIEWLEIERKGTRYIIRVEKRIKNTIEEKINKRHLIAKKSGIIMKIEAHDGEIVKKVNDYVSKGDIIVSGEIHKEDDIKDNVAAKAEVYAEVWYRVKVSLPLYYFEEIKTGNKLKTLKLKVLDKDYNIFNKNYLNKISKNKILFNDFYNMISLNYSIDNEILVKDEINSIDNENTIVNYAREKILNKLDKNEYIISQKKLKTIINNSTINVEVFFKVYENISSYFYY